MNFRKALFVFGALGMLLSSCNKISEIENLNESKGLPQEITATFNATRTSVDDSWNTTWDDNDKMTVYVTRESSRSYKYGYSQFTYKGDGKFDGKVNEDFCYPYNWFAIYPSFQSSSSTSKTVSAKIEHPAIQTMTGDTKAHIAGDNDPIFGYALGVQENPTIRMHHIASVIDFNIKNGSENAIKVTKVEFTAPGKIAGEFTADVNLWDGEVENPEWTAGSSAFNTVTLNVSDGVEIAKGGNSDFYAAIHPISANGSYTIKVTATSEGKTYVAEKTVNANFTFNAGKYKTVNFTFNATEPVQEKYYVKVTSAPQDWSGTYLIVDENAKMAFNENSDSYASSVTINDGKILQDETVAKYQVTISPSSVDGMYDIMTVNNKYVYSYNYCETTLNDSNKDGDKTYYNRLSINSGNVTMYSTRTGSGGSVNYFGYVSNTSDNPNNKNFGHKENATSRTVQLFKLENGGSGKQDQNLTFENTSVTWTLGDNYKVGSTYDAQTVQGAQTTVTYTSDKESVATVASDGKVTIQGTGSATITATATEDDTHNSATASYTLTINPTPTPATEKTYTKVTSLSNLTEGTYLICGYETAGTYVCLFPPVTATYTDQSKKFDTSNKFEHKLFSTDNGITTITTSDASIIGSEVKITKSGNNYLIQYDGKYMYYNNGTIDFSSTSSSATQAIGSFSSGKTSMTQGNQLFYHSGTNEGFGYKNRTGVSNIMFFKLEGEPDTPEPPTPSGAVFNLENNSLKSYLDDAESQYTDSNYSSKSVVTSYSSNSASNRKDTPAPVSISWTSTVSGTKTVYVYNDSSMSDLEMSTTTSSSSVDILNLVPNRQYWYKVVSSSSQQIASDTFSTTGRRRMLKVSDTYAIGHANNCRDLGGQKTTDGKTLKYGMIFRGTNMDATTDAEKDYLAGYMNIGLDVDLRNGSSSSVSSSSGNGSAYNPFNGSRGVSYVKGNFSGRIQDFHTTNSDAKTNMTNIFTQILSTFKKGKAAYIHCYVGADRTGYTCMLLEAVLGVSQKDCSIDFELTSFSVVGTRTRTGNGNPIGKDGLDYISGYSKGSTFQEKAYNILLDYGVTESQISEFRSMMLQ